MSKYLVSINLEEPDNCMVKAAGFTIEDGWVIFYEKGSHVAAFNQIHVVGVEKLEE